MEWAGRCDGYMRRLSKEGEFGAQGVEGAGMEVHVAPSFVHAHMNERDFNLGRLPCCYHWAAI